MLEKLQHYWLIASTFLLALLSYIILRRGDQIKDLQKEIIVNKLQDQLKTVVEKTQEDTDVFNQAVDRYNTLRDSYHKLYGGDS